VFVAETRRSRQEPRRFGYGTMTAEYLWPAHGGAGRNCAAAVYSTITAECS